MSLIPVTLSGPHIFFDCCFIPEEGEEQVMNAKEVYTEAGILQESDSDLVGGEVGLLWDEGEQQEMDVDDVNMD